MREVPLDPGRATSEDAVAEDEAQRRGPRVAGALLILAVLGGLLALQAAAPEEVTPAGYAARGDGARTGIVSTRTPAAPTGVAWRVPVGLPPLLGPAAQVLGTTTADDGRELLVALDAAASGRRVASHDAADGHLVAATMLPLGNQPYETSIGHGLLVHRDLRTVTLVDLSSGAHRWHRDLPLRDVTAVTRAGVLAVPADGAVGEVAPVLLDLDDGSQRWQADAVDGRVVHVLELDDALVLQLRVGAEIGLVALSPVDGRLLWEVAPDQLPPVSLPVARAATDGTDVVLLGIGGVVVIDGATAELTRLATDPDVVTRAAALHPEVIVLAATDRLLALDRVDGTARWSVPVPTPPVLTLAVRGDTVAGRGADGDVILLDATTGADLGGVGARQGDGRGVVLTDAGLARTTPSGDVEVVGPGGVVWQAPTVVAHLPDLATLDGAVALTTPDGVQVHDVSTGARRFAHAAFDPGLVGAGSLTAPALVGTRTVIGPPAGQPVARGGLRALFSETGIVAWARQDDRVVPRGTPVPDRDVLFVPVGSQLLGFDEDTGARRVVVETNIPRTDLAAADGWLVAVDAPLDSGDVWVGRRSDGELAYRAPVRTCAPPVIHGGLTILTLHNGDIIARNLETGEQPWGELARGSACRPLSIAGDTLVALVDDVELLGVGLDDGETSWRVTLPAHAAGAPTVAGTLVLVPLLDGTVVAWRPGDPEPSWVAEVGAVPAGSVAVDGDTLLVVTRAGELVALR